MDRRAEWSGTVYTFLSFLMWGFLPLYWKQLDGVPAIEMLAHRVIWAAVILILAVPVFQSRQLREALRDPRALATAMLAGTLLGANWFVFLWAVSADRLVQASLGYYITPLIIVILGVVFLRERLSRSQIVALALASIGVLILTFSQDQSPWVSIALALSFGTYGLVKKIGRLNTPVGMFFELLLLTPVAMIYIVIIQRSGEGAFASGNDHVTWLLAGAGIVTVIPLLFFGAGARRIPLSRVGFLQYVGPTTMLLIGVLLYGEPFEITHGVSFAFIWIALVIYTVTIIRGRVHLQKY